MNKLLMRTRERDATADPFVLYHDGYYYHTYTNAKGVYVSKTDDLNKLADAEETLVYAKKENEMRPWYAPEIWYLDGAWYIYVAPDYGDSFHNMTVLKYEGDTPVGQYENLGMMGGLENEWSIDGTILEHEGKRYFIWTKCAEMYMAEMSDPAHITGKIITLAHPELDWELKTGLVNEGAAVIKKGNKTHIIYSANDSKTDEYCLGCLTFTGGDVMDPNNWVKASKPLFEKTDKVFGPGHCSFTKVIEDGIEKDCMVYHANLISGSGWAGRNVFAKTIDWDENDMPILGKPEI